MKSEAGQLEALERVLTADELARVRTIQHTISYLLRVQPATVTLQPAPPEAPRIVTYKIVADMGGKLQTAARTACNFWNRFVEPKSPIVIRLGTFTENSQTIACAYKPYKKLGVHYSRVEFNTKFLATFSDHEIAGTITHEIGHSLGIGWKDWEKLYDPDTGRFTQDAVAALPALKNMEVEREGGGLLATTVQLDDRSGSSLTMEEKEAAYGLQLRRLLSHGSILPLFTGYGRTLQNTGLMMVTGASRRGSIAYVEGIQLICDFDSYSWVQEHVTIGSISGTDIRSSFSGVGIETTDEMTESLQKCAELHRERATTSTRYLDEQYQNALRNVAR